MMIWELKYCELSFYFHISSDLFEYDLITFPIDGTCFLYYYLISIRVSRHSERETFILTFYFSKRITLSWPSHGWKTNSLTDEDMLTNFIRNWFLNENTNIIFWSILRFEICEFMFEICEFMFENCEFMFEICDLLREFLAFHESKSYYISEK